MEDFKYTLQRISDTDNLEIFLEEYVLGKLNNQQLMRLTKEEILASDYVKYVEMPA